MKHCTTDKCPQILDSSCVFYEGPTLLFSGINTNDSVEVVIQKLNLKLESIPGINLDNYYTKTEVNSNLATKLDKPSTDGTYIVKKVGATITYEAFSDANYYTKAYIDTALQTKQANLGFVPENVANKQNTLSPDGTGKKYTTVDAVNSGLSNKLDKGTYAGTAQILKNEIDSKQKLLSSFDESILVETDGNIEGNISLFEEYFEQQECELNFNPIQIVAVYQDGIKLSNSEYEIILPKKIKIKEYVDENIQIEYTHLKS